MRRLAAIICVLIMLSGCVGGTGPNVNPIADGPTCETSQLALEESQLILDEFTQDGIIEGDAVRYWRIVNTGARLFLTLNGCTIRPPATVVK